MGDGLYTELVLVARDVYGRHPEELSKARHRHLLEFVALRRLEREAEELQLARIRK